jgi:ABC-type Na+ efflux pump permease subunit
MRDLRPIAIAVAVLGLFVGGLAALTRFMPLILDRSPAQVEVAVAAVDVLGFLMAPVAVAVVGDAAGKRVDVSQAYGRIAAIFGLLGGLAAFLGGVAAPSPSWTTPSGRPASGSS